jgi:hypothetical protein
VPPDILDRGTSTDQTVREGASVSLTCAAIGSPHPQITWRREHSRPMTISDGIQGKIHMDTHISYGILATVDAVTNYNMYLVL